MLAGLAISAAGVAVTLADSLPFVGAGLLVLVVGMFTAQAVGPSFVNEVATQAKGGANALYLTFYYLGGTLGSWLPGLAWERWGWSGVVASSGAAIGAAALAVWTLCRPLDTPRRSMATRGP
jgi:YNFM family putative membrane transporter